MRGFRTFFFSILIPLLFLAFPAAAQPVTGQGGGYYPGLGLSSSQTDQITDLRVNFQEQMLPLRNDLQAGYIKLRNLYREGSKTVDTEALRNEIVQIQQELESLYLDYKEQVRSLLKDEQKEIFNRWALSGPGFGGPGWGGRGWRGGRGGGAMGLRDSPAGLGMGRGNAMGLGLGPGMGLGLGAGPASGGGRGWRCPGRWYLW